MQLTVQSGLFQTEVFLRLCALRVPFDAPNIPGLVQKIASLLVTKLTLFSDKGQFQTRSFEHLMLLARKNGWTLNISPRSKRQCHQCRSLGQRLSSGGYMLCDMVSVSLWAAAIGMRRDNVSNFSWLVPFWRGRQHTPHSCENWLGRC